jgi:hypothetical protein
LLNSRTGDAASLRFAAVQHLHSAYDIFDKCLQKQKALLASYSTHPPPVPPVDNENMDQETGGVSLLPEASPADETMANAPEEGEQYAVITEPITPDAILDTLIEMLSTLSTLFPLLHAPRAMKALAETVLNTELQPLLQALPSRQTEIFITAAVLRCAIAESLFRSGYEPDVSKWEEAIANAFGADWEWQKSADALCAKSDAHASLASAVVEVGDPAELAWKHYAFSSQALGNAATLEPTKAKIYLARGDTELIRSRIVCPQRTEQVRDVLRKNAGVFYRGAARLAQREPEIKKEAEVKEAVLRFENGEAGVVGLKDAEAKDIIEEACDDEIFEAGMWARIVSHS